MRQWWGTMALCPIDLRKGDTATVNFDHINKGNAFVGVEGIIPDLPLQGPMTKAEIIQATLRWANKHVTNMVYYEITTKHCYGCEKVAEVVQTVTQRIKTLVHA
jgi:hypothetical protein